MFPDDENEGGGGDHDAGMMRWLITYADLITLLLAFFIIMYAVNRTQQIKMTLVAQALSAEFDSNTVVGQSPGPSIISGKSGIENLKELQSLNQLQQLLQAAVDREGLQNQVKISSDFRGVEMRLSATMLFPSGSAALSSQGVGFLNLVGQALESVPNSVVVSGYTDSLPIHSPQYVSNWQLSAMRAANVVDTLSKVAGLNPGRLSVAGYSKYRPIATNSTSAGRAQNRRVTILVERQAVSNLLSSQPSFSSERK